MSESTADKYITIIIKSGDYFGGVLSVVCSFIYFMYSVYYVE